MQATFLAPAPFPTRLHTSKPEPFPPCPAPLQEASKAALRASKGSGGELRGRKLRLTLAKKQAGEKGKPAAWQQGKDSGSKGGKSGGKSSKPVAGKRKAGGKRPAVLARKAAAKLAAKGGVQKKRSA